MNEIISKFLLPGDKFMPGMHLRQPGFRYSASGPVNENKERMQMFKQTGDWWYIYQNELHKTSFYYDMDYGDFKV